jgi:hypothetical protein
MAMQFSYWQPFLKKNKGVKGAKNGTFPGRVDLNFSSMSANIPKSLLRSFCIHQDKYI